MCKKRLHGLGQMLDSSVEDAAWQMMSDDYFQSNKKELGSGRWRDTDTFQIKIPYLKQSMSNTTDASFRIKGGEMQFTW